jgi:hypothetical protein
MATLDPLAPPVSLAAAVPVADVAACPSCGAAMGGAYCPACGEKRVLEEHFSIRHFLGELWEELFDLDSRAVRSVRTLLFSPGTLTVEYLRGRRRPFLGPLRMFLAVFALVLFIGTLVPTEGAARRQKQEDAITRQFRAMVHSVAVRTGRTDAQVHAALAEDAAQAESWLAVTIPALFAGVLFACFGRRRRWYAEHLVFATHFATFNYVVALLLFPLAFLVPSHVVALPLFVATYLAMLAYLAIAIRRVYGSRPVAAAVWAFCLMIAFSVVQGVVGLAAVGVAAARLEWF